MKPIFPIYEFLITDEDENDMSGVNTFSLVSKPAMKTDFIKFSEIPMQKYIFIEKDKKQYKGIVAGIAMKPNELIPRITDSGEKFLGYFSPETIEKIRTKFHRNPENQKAVNLEHNHNNFVNAFLIESYILDSQEMVNAVKAKGIKDATIGSWYTAFKIEDKEVFERCLKGEFNGFSVEAFLNAELAKNNFSTLNIKKMKKNIIQNVKEKLNAILEEMSFKEALVPELNIKVSWGSVGDEVTKTYQDTEGNEKTEPVGQGEFVIEDGRTLIVDENSTLVEIRDKVEEKPEEMVEEEKPVEEKKEEEKVEMPVEELPVSGDTKQEEMEVECVECKDLPWDECIAKMMEQYDDEETAKKVCGKIKAENMSEEEKAVSGDTKTEDEKKEDMPVLSGDTKTEDEKVEELPVDEEEFAPMGNDNACQHGRRSTDASGYCNGMASPEKATGTYKQGKKVKKEEDKPAEKKEEAPKAEEKPKAEAPKAEEKKEAQKIEKEVTDDIIADSNKDKALIKKAEDEKLPEDERNAAKRAWVENAVKDSERRIAEYKKDDTMKDLVPFFEKELERKKKILADNDIEGINKIFNRRKITSEENKKIVDNINKEFEKRMKEGFGYEDFSEVTSIIQENFAALQSENEALKAEVAALKVKLSEPIAEPKLKDEEPKPVDFSKLSNYEKAALRKGLPIL